MDLTYLLWLQELRERVPELVTMLFYQISESAVAVWFGLIPLLIYYLIDKEKGLFILMSTGLCSCVNSVLKLTACVYRPWLREPAIRPYAKALKTAGGYSFPSGHTARASSLAFGAVASRLCDRINVLLVIYALLVAFSRNWLGCHTPQDVLVALLDSLILVYLLLRFKKFLEEHPSADLCCFVIGLLFLAFVIIYLMGKGYPIDRDASGHIIASPVAMQAGSMLNIGSAAGIWMGWFFERRTLCFSTAELKWPQMMLRLVVTAVFVGFFYGIVKPALWNLSDPRIGRLLLGFSMYFTGVYLIPAVFTGSERLYRRYFVRTVK